MIHYASPSQASQKEFFVNDFNLRVVEFKKLFDSLSQEKKNAIFFDFEKRQSLKLLNQDPKTIAEADYQKYIDALDQLVDMVYLYEDTVEQKKDDQNLDANNKNTSLDSTIEANLDEKQLEKQKFVEEAKTQIDKYQNLLNDLSKNDPQKYNKFLQLIISTQ